MKSSSAAVKLITCIEGFKSAPYKDTANIWTVGWGHALTTPTGQQISVKNFGDKAAGLVPAAMQKLCGASTITKAQADALMLTDIAPREQELAKLLPPDTTQSQFDAMMSFAYNIGVHGFDGTAVKRLHLAGNRKIGNLSLIDTCKASKAKAEPTTMTIAFARWSNSGGVWTLGLFRRRMAEVMVYSGWDAQKAVDAAWAFHD